MASCKRILIVGRAKSGKLAFLKALTGSLPDEIPKDSHGGLTHQLALETKYYKSNVDIWVDEFEAPEAFDEMYLSPEASEVRSSLGAIVLCLADDTGADEAIEQLKRVADVCSADPLYLTVLRVGPQEGDARQMLEDTCLDHGSELICMDAQGRNAFGERQGIERARECIETTDWSEFLEEAREDEIEAMLREDKALNETLLNKDIAGSDLNVDEATVEELEGLMQRILQAREHSSDLSMEEKKKMAAKLVADVMRSSV